MWLPGTGLDWGVWGSLESGAKERRVGRVDPRQHLGLEGTDGSSFLLQNFPSTPPLGCGESGGIQRPKPVFSGLLLGAGRLWAQPFPLSSFQAYTVAAHPVPPFCSGCQPALFGASARERKELKVRTEATLLIL